MPLMRFVAAHGVDGGPMVPDFDAQDAGFRAFIGRKLDPSQGQPFVNPVTKQADRHPVFVAVTGPDAIHEVDERSAHAGEYLRHLRDGDLLPADQFTAQLAGKKFDPKLTGAAMFGDTSPKAAPDASKADVHAAMMKARGDSTKAPDAPASVVAGKVAS